MRVQITEKQAEILKDIQKTCQERAGVPWTTYIWEVYARTIREVLESADKEQSE